MQVAESLDTAEGHGHVEEQLDEVVGGELAEAGELTQVERRRGGGGVAQVASATARVPVAGVPPGRVAVRVASTAICDPPVPVVSGGSQLTSNIVVASEAPCHSAWVILPSAAAPVPGSTKATSAASDASAVPVTPTESTPRRRSGSVDRSAPRRPRRWIPEVTVAGAGGGGSGVPGSV